MNKRKRGWLIIPKVHLDSEAYTRQFLKAVRSQNLLDTLECSILHAHKWHSFESTLLYNREKQWINISELGGPF